MNYFNKIILFLWLVVLNPISSQPLNESIFTDIYVSPQDEFTSQFYFMYKIPVNNLIFSKANNEFKSEIQITVELRDSVSNFIKRIITNKIITSDEFSFTVDPNGYTEGLITFSAENRSYNINCIIEELISTRTIYTKERFVKRRETVNSNYLMPIILENKKYPCDKTLTGVLPNFGGFIPFDSRSYDFLISARDTSVNKIFVKVISKFDTVFNGSLTRDDISSVNFLECENRIITTKDINLRANANFYLPDISQKLNQGPIEIIVGEDENFKDKETFRPIVKWINKPISLKDSEAAIRQLKFLISEDSIRSILKKSNDYDSLLNSFWKIKDPTPKTEFNELMAEYYERIDYSTNNFSTISGIPGIQTDRGSIYVRYGKPTSIERSTNGEGKVSESWFYSKLNKYFYFVDERGTGEFTLKERL